MSFESFLTRAGFGGDPFASTNAEQEDRLSDYFVPPPYFESVLGDPTTPKTNVVFAPRGSGKTAQRLMIERLSGADESNFLCLTYDKFSTVQKAGGKLADHQLELCRLLTIGILSRLESKPAHVVMLNAHEREVVKSAGLSLLGSLTIGQYEDAIRSVKTLGDKAGEFWKKYGGPVAAGLAILIKKAGLDDVSLALPLPTVGDTLTASVSYYYPTLVAVCQELEWEAVYFLVDKVDETSSTTTNADAAGRLIGELITDLPTIEAPGVAFKFFFWDRMEPYLQTIGLRRDRMEVVTLGWTTHELSQMLSRRLATFSEGGINSFNQLISTDEIDFHLLLVHLSQGSPRDMIRMARAIVTEHTRMDTEANRILAATAFIGILNFSKASTGERYPQTQGEFLKVGEPSFTLTGLASMFKISSKGAGNKTQAWITAGAVQPLGTKANPGKKPLNLYGFTDMRIVLASVPASEIELALDNYALECPDCFQLTVCGEAEFDCPACGSTLAVGGARSLLTICKS